MLAAPRFGVVVVVVRRVVRAGVFRFRLVAAEAVEVEGPSAPIRNRTMSPASREIRRARKQRTLAVEVSSPKPSSRPGSQPGVRSPTVSDLRDDQAFGANEWLVDDMRDQWRGNPVAVSESWRAYFETEKFVSAGASSGRSAAEAPSAAEGPSAVEGPSAEVMAQLSAAPVPVPATPVSAGPTPAAHGHASAPLVSAGEPLRGVAAKIVSNMEASLGVPTATSVRDVPAKLLEVNRNIINNHMRRTRGGKTSFTHLIAFAIVRALDDVPSMRNTYGVDANGNPQIVRHTGVGLGIAVDVTKSDGSHSLVVPCVKNANTLTFRQFHTAYEALIEKARINKLGVEDFAGVTVSITNPGGIGTRHSVPRLMSGQAAIIGLGAIDYPAAFIAADPSKLAEIGISKTVTLTSTYDHRIIQGAESGLFLDRVQKLLMGDDGYYDDVFESMGIPYEPARWNRDHNPADEITSAEVKTAAVQEIINAYRSRGHLIADLDPLDAKGPQMPAELDPATYGLSIWDLDRELYTGKIGPTDYHTLGNLLGLLRDAYCRTTGIEYMHIMDPVQKKWIQQHVEGVNTTLDVDSQRHVLSRLNAAEAFEKFLAKRYPGTKRFGLEGGESAMVILDAVLDSAAAEGLEEAVLGMPHRGRLSTLVNVVGKSVNQLFKEFEDLIEGTVYGSGDVKYHLGAEGKYTGLNGQSIAVSLAPNPSHLEAVDPVVEGIVRAKLDLLNDPGTIAVLPILLHGDSAFIGQGVVAETLNLSQLAGYKTGGTVHLVVNNQVGFTTNPESARSSVYCTDIAKMVQAPIFHVNGDDPEACYRVGKLAFAFRQEFKKDVVIDMVCYRRMGHNEGDEPRYTQPLMYERIDNHPSTRELYAANLVGRKDITQEEADRAYADFQARMQSALDETRNAGASGEIMPPNADDIGSPFDPVATGVARSMLDLIAAATHSWPATFTPHPKLAKQLETRAESYATGEVDWALGEAFAFGSMALEGRAVRISGQDSRRGTFSHRQAVLIDVNTGAEHYPLKGLAPDQGNFTVYDSSLSEYAVLGFEYGYSFANPEAFVAWEAQFGDFVNGAQTMIDQFIVAAETKWKQLVSLVMLLPHGYEGQGPEHSSARLERFLQSCAEENIRVANVTTSVQLFHLLRRQVHSPNRKPLVVMSPKSGLRAKQSRSHVDEFTTGAFREVLDDVGIGDPAAVRRVVLCSGKVAWDAVAARDAAGLTQHVAVVRVEQLYPWPESQVADIVGRYSNADEVVWLQEEPENMGGWTFVAPKLTSIATAAGTSLRVVARPGSGSPAVGSHHAHDHELDHLKSAILQNL